MTWGLYSAANVRVDNGPLEMLLKKHLEYEWHVEYIKGSFVLLGVNHGQDGEDALYVKIKEISDSHAQSTCTPSDSEDEAPETKRSIPPTAYADRTASVLDG